MGCVPGAIPCLEVSSTPTRNPSPFFQVLKSQRWEKKKAAAEALRSQMHQPGTKVGAGHATATHPGTTQAQEKP